MQSRPEQMRAPGTTVTDRVPGRSSPSLQPLLALGLGVALSCGIAVVAEGLARYAPLIGAPILAIALGVLLANLTGRLHMARRLRIKEISSWALRGGIVLLGFTLDLHDVLRTGGNSLALLAVTMAAGLGFAFIVGRWLGTDWRVRALIGVGTTICGASAIAALAPVIRARGEEVGYSIAVIFFFNMLAVLLFPPIGHLIGLSDNGFGLWAGTAVNDTSAVVAAGFAYSHAAGTYATIVKLTRTTLIIPITFAFGLLMPWLTSEPSERETGLGSRLLGSIPWFIGLFAIASLLNSAGIVGHQAQIQDFARFVLVIALAAVGLQGHWRAFAGAGVRPLLLGLGTWAAVALTSLAIQAATAQF